LSDDAQPSHFDAIGIQDGGYPTRPYIGNADPQCIQANSISHEPDVTGGSYLHEIQLLEATARDLADDIIAEYTREIKNMQSDAKAMGKKLYCALQPMAKMNGGSLSLEWTVRGHTKKGRAGLKPLMYYKKVYRRPGKPTCDREELLHYAKDHDRDVVWRIEEQLGLVRMLWADLMLKKRAYVSLRRCMKPLRERLLKVSLE
jgi:hypothetical protein